MVIVWRWPARWPRRGCPPVRANYLKSIGWRKNQPCFFKIELKKNIPTKKIIYGLDFKIINKTPLLSVNGWTENITLINDTVTFEAGSYGSADDFIIIEVAEGSSLPQNLLLNPTSGSDEFYFGPGPSNLNLYTNQKFAIKVYEKFQLLKASRKNNL